MLARILSLFGDPKAPPLDLIYFQNTRTLAQALSGWLPEQEGVISTHLSGNERKLAIFYKDGVTHWLDLPQTSAELHPMISSQRRRYLTDLSNSAFVQRLGHDAIA